MRPSRAKPHKGSYGPAQRRVRAYALRGYWPWAAIGLVWAAALAARVWPFSIDDAFIVARYATRIARGASYTFDDGPPTDGVTGPLWLLPLVVGARFGADVMHVGKLLGWLCCAAAVLLLQRSAATRALGGRTQALFVLFAASSAPLWIWATAGLETGAATLAASAVLWGVTRRPAPRPAIAGGAAALLAWLRPELALLVGALLALLWWRARRAGWLALALASLGALSLLAFRWSLFGRLLPLSAYAKPAGLENGAQYVLHCTAQPSALALLPGLVAALLWGRRDERVLLAAGVVQALAVLLAGGDWMPGARLFVPLIPALCLVAAAGLSRAWLRHRALAVAFAVLAVAARAPALIAETARAQAAGLARQQRLPQLLDALAGVSDPIALLDIGAVGHYSGRALIDLGGLTEPAIAFAPGGHVAKRVPPDWLRRKAPGAIVLHSAERPRVDKAGRLRWFAGYPVERHVLAMPWVQAGYRVQASIAYQPAYFYVVLVPRGSIGP
jgi:arabinofuranosyltransferase